MFVEIPLHVCVYACILLVMLIIAVTCCVIDTVLAIGNYISIKKERKNKMIEDLVGDIVDEKINPGGGI